MWQQELALYKQHHSVQEGLHATALMDAAMGLAALENKTAKHKYHELRPFQMDHSIKVIGPMPNDSSYPSGHATSAAAAASVLEQLDPANKARYERLLHDVEWARVYSGVHFPSDVRAGEALGRRAADQASVGVPVVGAVASGISSMTPFAPVGNLLGSILP
jgi:hypothetical protein